MIRGDKIICGTSTTGTGTLTLAACPVAAAGVDFDVFARATGVGFSNNAAVLVSYTIIEYADSTFAGAKSHEKGIGTLTLGGSSGIANCTLARTTVQTTATSLNSQPATQNIGGAGFSIGTAANTLVFIGASAADTLCAVEPYVETGSGGGNFGLTPLSTIPVGAPTSNACQVSGTDYYYPFYWPCTMLVKTCRIHVKTTYSGTSNAYARIYAINTSGQPGKLIYDFGLLGTANTTFNAGGVKASAAGNGFFLTPGAYFIDLLHIFSGGAGTPDIYGSGCMISPGTCGADGGQVGLNGMLPIYGAVATSGNATAPDPANVTGYALSAFGGTNGVASFSFRSS